MLNQGTIFAVIVSCLVSSQHASPINKDIEAILDKLNGKKDIDLDTTSDENIDIYGRLNTIDVIDLIQNTNHDKNAAVTQNKRWTGAQDRISYKDRNTQKILEQLLQGNDAVHLTHKKHQSLNPNDLLGPVSLKYDAGQTDANEYSKIFVIFDPLALQKSKNQNALSDLLSRILSLSSSSDEKSRQNKSHGYKGYNVNRNILSRRYRRDSKEGYGARDSMEDDYKPKRPRNEHGGGAGGRTAIPYIRQRGDIYERDH